MITWKDFTDGTAPRAASDLAQAGSALLIQFSMGLAFLATLRRLHPVCPVLSGDGLVVLITSALPKHISST